MISFKIYEQLEKEIQGDTTSIKKLDKQHCSTINRLKIEHREIIFLLIYHHYVIYILKYDKNRRNELPYGCKIGIKGKGINFDGSHLPIHLQQIIVKYLEKITY